MSFCILIPTINRKDLLMEALEHYIIAYPNTDIFIVDNGFQIIPQLSNNMRIYDQLTNLGVSGSWNFLINKAIENKHTNFLILNDDIVLKKSEEIINSIIDNNIQDTLHVPNKQYNWSAFLLNEYVYNIVGEFDQGFTRCYFEDNDYAYRINLAKMKIREEPLLNAEVYRNSMTIQKDPFLSTFAENQKYYISKWGGMPEQETYTIPFNKI
ncbi:MAG: glycosyltransferase family 2 protein [Candidatus Kapaibacteriota bacterium]